MDQFYAQLAEDLSRSLRLAQPPVAVCFSDSVPASISMHNGAAPAGCSFWREAASAAFITSPSDHALCAVGSYTHNLEMSAIQQTDLEDCLGVFGSLGYLTAEDLSLIPVLDRRPRHVIYAPLAQSPLLPDVVLLFGDASQSLIVSEAVQQVERRIPPALGRPACAVISQVANTGLAALSLGCCGARAYVDTFTSDLILCALPGTGLAKYVERIVALADANLVLKQFHQLRGRHVAAGAKPTVHESLTAMESPGD